MFPLLRSSVSGRTFHKPSGGMFLDPYQADLTSGVITKVLLDDIIPGYTDGIEDTVNNRIIPGVPGLYLICGQIHYQNIIALKHYQLMIKENGVTIHSMVIHSSDDMGTEISVIFSKIIQVNLLTDFYELFARQNSGVNTVDITNGIGATYLMMSRIR